MNRPQPASLRSLFGTLAALFALMLLSLGSAYLPMGVFHTVTGLAIAVAKALLVMLFFMELRHGSPLLRIVAGLGFAWLALLLTISIGDYLTRVPIPPPW